MFNKRGSGIDTIIASIWAFLVQFSILVFFISAMLFFTVEQQLQVEAQHFIIMTTRNEINEENLWNFTDYLNKRLQKYELLGFNELMAKFEVYRVQSGGSQGLQLQEIFSWDTLQPKADFENNYRMNVEKPREGDIIEVIIKQGYSDDTQGVNSLFGRVMSFLTNKDVSITIAVRKVGAFER